MFCPAEASDSFSKEDMMVNGVATARSTFFDMVHPTSTKEASAHAHAVLRNNGHHAAAPAAAAPACSSVQAAAGCATTAAPAASRVPTPPMAITGVSSVSRCKNCCSGLLLHAMSTRLCRCGASQGMPGCFCMLAEVTCLPICIVYEALISASAC